MLLFNKNKFRADCYILFEISIKFIFMGTFQHKHFSKSLQNFVYVC